MSRLIALRRLAFAALATTAIALACRAGPGEAPPLAPRPEPVEPSANPVPGAPDPIDPSMPGPSAPTTDAGVPISVITPPIYKAQASDGGVDGGPGDGGPDGGPDDGGAGGPDALDPGSPPETAQDGGPQDLPPVPDADLPSLPGDAGGPYR